MSVVRNILLIALALLLQSTVGLRIAIMGVRPDLAFLMLLLIAERSTTVQAVCYGFFIGFLQDIYSPEYLGYNSFAMSLAGYLLGEMKERFAVEHTAVKITAILVTLLVHDVVYLAFNTSFAFGPALNVFIRQSLPGAVYTALAGVVAVKVWKWLEQGGLFVVVRELMESGR